VNAAEYKNMIQGRINKAQGKNFEDEIDQTCAYYRSTGQAYIEKNHEPFTVTRSLGRGQFMGHFAKASQTDYTGILAGGRAVCFEAKYTATDRLTQDRVEPHQAADLDEKSKLGALCFVLCAIDCTVYAVPWAVWKNMKSEFGHKYLSREDGRKYEVERRDGAILFLEKIAAVTGKQYEKENGSHDEAKEE
jgi:recombination protein U